MENDLNKRPKIWIVGFVFDESERQPNIFALIKTGDIETPVSENGKILIFGENTLIEYLFEKYELVYLKEELYTELDIILNISNLIKRIKLSKMDNKSLIINSLNIIFDLTKYLDAGKKRNPHVNIFYSFANHLTFEKEFAESYFNKNNINKNDLLDSIYWHIGLLFANSKFI